MCRSCGSNFWDYLGTACVILTVTIYLMVVVVAVRWQHVPVTNCYGHWSDTVMTSETTATRFDITDRCETK